MLLDHKHLLLCVKTPLIMISPTGLIEFVNEPALSLLGERRDQIEGLHVMAQRWRLLNMSGEPLEEAQRPFRLINTPTAYNEQTLLLELADKSRRVVEFEGTLLDPGATPSAALFTIRDVSALHAARQELLSKEEHLLEAQVIARVGSWYYDMETRLLSWSPQVFRLLGLDPSGPSPSFEDFLGWVPDNERAQWIATVQPTFSDGRPYEIAHNLVLPDGSTRRVLSRGCGKYQGDQLIGISGTAQDITEQYTSEQRNVALINELHEAQRLRSIGLLAGGVAHDFNNLLAGVIGNASLLQDDLAQNEQLAALIADIMLASNQMVELTNHLLAYSGKSKRNTKKVNIYNAINETYHVIRLSIPKNCKFVMDRPDEPIWIDADPGHLRQILLNIIVNAAEAVAEREVGLIRLSISSVLAPPKPLYTQVTTRRFAHIVITDNGLGMDPQTMSQIFDPFFTTKLTGRGLGLSAVQGFVRAMGGSLDVTSVVGQGTSFHLYIPLSSPDEASSLEQISNTSVELHGLALVIDDEVLVQNVCRRTLERLGFQVKCASQGEEALRWLDDAPEPPKLALIDVIMPGISGFELFGIIRQRISSLPVIIMSGYTEQSFDDTTAHEKNLHFIQKPFYPKDLKDLILNILDITPPT
jgi:signal transduction histidine kinase/CheY-like chemotaxis protein